jgi:hypothetical protein
VEIAPLPLVVEVLGSYFNLPHNGLIAIKADIRHLPSFAKDEKQDKHKTPADGS